MQGSIPIKLGDANLTPMSYLFSQVAAERYLEAVFQLRGDMPMLWVTAHQGQMIGSRQFALD